MLLITPYYVVMQATISEQGPRIDAVTFVKFILILLKDK